MFWCGCEVERWLQHRKHGEGWDSRDSRDSRPRSCTVPSPPLAPLPAERSGSESDITASWSPWTRARWSKMIRCEKAKKEAKKRKEANYEFFVQQKMFFARDVFRFERIVIVSRWAIAKTFGSAWGRTFGYNEFGIFGPLVMSFGESIILSLADVETRPKSRQCRRLDANISWILDD